MLLASSPVTSFYPFTPQSWPLHLISPLHHLLLSSSLSLLLLLLLVTSTSCFASLPWLNFLLYPPIFFVFVSPPLLLYLFQFLLLSPPVLPPAAGRVLISPPLHLSDCDLLAWLKTDNHIHKIQLGIWQYNHRLLNYSAELNKAES